MYTTTTTRRRTRTKRRTTTLAVSAAVAVAYIKVDELNALCFSRARVSRVCRQWRASRAHASQLIFYLVVYTFWHCFVGCVALHCTSGKSPSIMIHAGAKSGPVNSRYIVSPVVPPIFFCSWWPADTVFFFLLLRILLLRQNRSAAAAAAAATTSKMSFIRNFIDGYNDFMVNSRGQPIITIIHIYYYYRII